MENINEKFDILTDPAKSKFILQESGFFAPAKINNLTLVVLKKYKDDVSFGMTLLYEIILDSQEGQIVKKVLGSASSWGVHEYTYKMTELISKEMAQNPEFNYIPQIYGYISDCGLFLREYVSGNSLTDVILQKGFLDETMADKIAVLVQLLQKLNPPSDIESGIDFNDIEYNIRELKRRGNKEVLGIEEKLNSIKAKIQDWQLTFGRTLVHGDLNTSNIVFREGAPIVIDFENTFRGDQLIDPAMFVSHLKALEKRGLAQKDAQTSVENFLKSFEKIKGGLKTEEKERFETYVLYYDLLILAYRLLWE